MGTILNRGSLVQALAPELHRRAGRGDDAALHALAAGELVPDDTILLPLLTGSRSWRDAAESGYTFPAEHSDICRAWFPGWSEDLPVPYTHESDRY
jgi:hypothetical protein